jgi:chromosome segregation ATPase
LQSLKIQQMEANLEIENLKFKLNEFEKQDYNKKIKEYEENKAELKSQIKKYLDELRALTSEYRIKENKIKDLMETIKSLKKDLKEVVFSKTKEINNLSGQLSEVIKDRESLLEYKLKNTEFACQLETCNKQKLILEKENNNLKDQLILTKENFQALEANTLDLQGKLWKQSQACESLRPQSKELVERTKAHYRNTSTSMSSRSIQRLRTPSPSVEKSLQRLDFDAPTHITIPPAVNSKPLLESQEITIELITNTLHQAHQDLFSANEKAKNAQTESEKLGNHNKTLENLLKDFEQNNHNLIKEINTLNAQLHNLTAVKSKHELENNTNKAKISVMQGIIDNLEQEKSKVPYNTNKNLIDHSNLNDINTLNLKKELNNAKNIAAKCETEIYELNNDKDELLKEIDRLKAEIRSIEPFRRGFDKAESDRINLTHRLQDLQAEFKDYKTSKENIIENMKIDLQKLENHRLDLLDKENSMKNIISGLENAQEEFLIRKKNYENEYRALEAQISLYKSNAMHAESLLDSKSTEINSYTLKIQSLESSNSSLALELRKLNDFITTEAQKNDSKMRILTSDIEKSSIQVTSLESELNATQKELLKLQTKEKDLIELNYSINKEYQKACQDLNTIKSQLNNSNNLESDPKYLKKIKESSLEIEKLQFLLNQKNKEYVLFRLNDKNLLIEQKNQDLYDLEQDLIGKTSLNEDLAALNIKIKEKYEGELDELYKRYNTL